MQRHNKAVNEKADLKILKDIFLDWMIWVHCTQQSAKLTFFYESFLGIVCSFSIDFCGLNG